MTYPIFAQPESVIALPDQAAFIAFLDQFDVPYARWNESEEMLEKYWREIQSQDAVYTTTHAFFGRTYRNMPLRFLITLSSWVAIRDGRDTLVLHERTFNPRTDAYELRRLTVSEKAKLDRAGRLVETPEQTLRRLLGEENGISVTEQEILDGLHFKPWTSPVPLIGGAKRIEQDSKQKELLPGIWHFNQVAHYYSYLPEHAYFAGMRLDKATRYLSSWCSAQEDSDQLEPIPADLILK